MAVTLSGLLNRFADDVPMEVLERWTRECYLDVTILKRRDNLVAQAERLVGACMRRLMDFISRELTGEDYDMARARSAKEHSIEVMSKGGAARWDCTGDHAGCEGVLGRSGEALPWQGQRGGAHPYVAGRHGHAFAQGAAITGGAGEDLWQGLQ